MAINNNSTINGTTESAAFTYDNLGRLVTSNQTSNGSSAQRRFAYDRWGNRTGVWDATSGGTQIQSITLQGSGGIPTNQIASVTAGSTVNYLYDPAGNVTNDGVHTYTYDSENRLVSVDGGSTASYAYDHQNRRYKKTIGSTVTHYVWLGSQVLAEHNGSTGAVLIDYVYSGTRMIAKIASGITQYFLSDRLSTRLVLDTSGSVLGRMAHLPFGDDFAESGTQEKHHLTSYERDSELTSDYAVNRQYAQNLGRFMRVDPKESSAREPQSLNRYTYVVNDPIRLIDPFGLDFFQGPTGGFDWWSTLPFWAFFSNYPPGEDLDSTPNLPIAKASFCVVTVTARELEYRPLAALGFAHLFITTWDTATNETDYFGVTGEGGGSGHSGGLLVAHWGLYDESHARVDFMNPNIVKQFLPKVFPGSCDDLFDQWASASGSINRRKITYHPKDGPNSNSYVFTLLRLASFTDLISDISAWESQNQVIITIPFPGGVHTEYYSPIPGWGQYIL
jgi:RHS repeat-associated protein